MRLWPLTGVFCLLSLVATYNVSADTQYWVAVGSYQNPVNAEIAQSKASAILPETFSIEPADTLGGLYYRVLAGPYLTREIAEHMVSEAKRNGFESAWIYAAESDLYSSSVRDYAETYRAEEAEVLAPLLPPSTEGEAPGYDLPERQESNDEPRLLIEEAPDGYSLHKLNRDQASVDWDSPFLLASNQQTVISAALAAQTELQSLQNEVIEVDLQTGEPLALQRWEHKEAGIKIDGLVSERAWQNAISVNLMKVTDPDTLEDPPFDTNVRIFYTERGIYVSFDMEQPKETLVKRLSSRDERRVNRDHVSFTLDTSGEGRYAYWMNLSLGDTQGDGTALPERQYSSNWDGAWYGATSETDHGWSAEFFIPWSQMSMPKQPEQRKIGFYSSRKVAHLNQRWAWPALPRSQPRFMSAFQPLTVSGVDPKQQWSFFPYASSRTDLVESGKGTFKAGADLFWRPSTNLQLTATANPDFGTVEADDVIVNLTAFETFFPEKRLFFLEGREIFEATTRATGRGEPVTLLNTRRIGASPLVPDDIPIDEDFPVKELARPTSLYGAGKVTGQVGGFRYGVLTAFEQDTNLVGDSGNKYRALGRDYAVTRVLYENNRGGTYRAVGLMSTLTAHEAGDAVSHGMDYHYMSATGTWKVDGQFLYSDLDLVGTGSGGFIDVEYAPRMGQQHRFELSKYDNKLDINELGFLRRNDITSFKYGAEWVRSGLTAIRNFEVEPFLHYEENGDGYAVNSGLGAKADFTLNNLNEIELAAGYFPSRYDDKNSFDNGTYRVNERPSLGVGFETDSSKKLSANLGTNWRGDGIDGQMLKGWAGLQWRPVERLNMELSASYLVRDGWLLHQEGRNMTSFDAEQWQPELQFDLFLTAKQEFKLALQWVGIKAFEDKFYQVPESPGDLIEVEKTDADSDDFNISALSFQMRYRWQIAPLSDLFVVYTKIGFDDTQPAQFDELFRNAWNDPLGEQLVVKLRYRLGT